MLFHSGGDHATAVEHYRAVAGKFDDAALALEYLTKAALELEPTITIRAGGTEPAQASGAGFGGARRASGVGLGDWGARR